jgi:hypothetical protein
MGFMLGQIWQSPSPKLIKDHAKVGKRAGDTKKVDFDEYDFVIVGGGTTFISYFRTKLKENR